jgi:hypothetical protein
VYVGVKGNDEQAVNTIESHLKRELRLLGDVDIVRENDDWEYLIAIDVSELKLKDGTETQVYAIGTYHANRLEKEYTVLFNFLKPTYNGILGSAYYPRENLHEFCINVAGKFEKDKLEFPRSTIEKLKR